MSESQALCLASPATVHLLSPPILSLSSSLFFLQRMDRDLSACTLHSFPP